MVQRECNSAEGTGFIEKQVKLNKKGGGRSIFYCVSHKL